MYHHGPQTRDSTRNAIDKDRITKWLYSQGRHNPLPYALNVLPDATDLTIIEIDKGTFEKHFKNRYNNYADYQRNHGKRRSSRLISFEQKKM